MSHAKSVSNRRVGPAIHNAASVAGLLLGAALFLWGCAPEASSPPVQSPSPPNRSMGESKQADPVAETGRASPPPPVADAPYGGRTPVDPIAVNGPVFVDWPAPRAALMLTGELDGYLEPCGCAGLENQKGGLARRHSLLRDLEVRGWPVVPLDLGGIVRRYGRQSEIKFQFAVEAYRTLGYRAVGFGPNDLRMPVGELAAAAAPTNGEPPPFVAANVALFDATSGLTESSRVVEAGGFKIGVTQVLADSLASQVQPGEIVLRPAAEALAELLPELKKKSDFVVLLCHGSPEESTELARRFAEQVDVVVTALGGDEPPREMARVGESGPWLVEIGKKGMYAAVLGLYPSEGEGQPPTARYQRVPLDSRYGDSVEMFRLMEAYQAQLQQTGFAGLGLSPADHPRARGEDAEAGTFVGAAKCGECHKTAFAKWSTTPHAHATESLVQRRLPPRQFDPECVSCHVTGWNPPDYTPYVSGYESLAATPLLGGNGCENCHGPGAAHVAAEAGRDVVRRDAQRAGMKLSRATAEEQVCAKCHDHDNSPDFDFAKYWPKVEHMGKK